MAEENTILLVEDDHDLAELTTEYLESFGYVVEVEENGSVAIDRIKSENPCLVILDVMLPGADGMEVCRSVRPHYHNPIIMLTARTDQIDQILGLEIGADDYICKPVEPRLLAAKVKAHMRREDRADSSSQVSQSGATKLVFDDLEIDNGARKATLNGEDIDLSTPEYDLLWLLASCAGQVLSRDEIFNNLRGIEYDGQNRAVDIHISHIRAKVGDDPSKPTRIKTVRGKGYIFVKET